MKINAYTNIIGAFLWNDDNRVKPFLWTINWFDETSLHLAVKFVLQRFLVSYSIVAKSSCGNWNCIWCEVNCGRVICHTSYTFTKNVWVLQCNPVKLWSMPKWNWGVHFLLQIFIVVNFFLWLSTWLQHYLMWTKMALCSSWQCWVLGTFASKE